MDFWISILAYTYIYTNVNDRCHSNPRTLTNVWFIDFDLHANYYPFSIVWFNANFFHNKNFEDVGVWKVSTIRICSFLIKRRLEIEISVMKIWNTGPLKPILVYMVMDWNWNYWNINVNMSCSTIYVLSTLIFTSSHS